MLKAGTFIIGLTSGLYLGVYLREHGYSSGLTRAYYAYRNEDYNKKGPKNKATVDDKISVLIYDNKINYLFPSQTGQYFHPGLFVIFLPIPHLHSP